MRDEIDEAGMVRQMVLAEAAAAGQEQAFVTVGRAIGTSKWTCWGIWNNRRKDFSGDLIKKIRRAYLAHCRQQLAKAEAALRFAEARYGDAHFADYQSEIADLARRIQSAEQRLDGG